MKTVLITGCSSGIGYDAAHALRFFATGAQAQQRGGQQAQGQMTCVHDLPPFCAPGLLP